MRRRYVLLWKDGDRIKGHLSALHLAMCCCIICVSKMFYHPSGGGEWMAHSWTAEQSYFFFFCIVRMVLQYCLSFIGSVDYLISHNLHYFQPNGILEEKNPSRSGLFPFISIITFQNLNRRKLNLKFEWVGHIRQELQRKKNQKNSPIFMEDNLNRRE